jgi:hypothetical protein
VNSTVLLLDEYVGLGADPTRSSMLPDYARRKDPVTKTRTARCASSTYSPAAASLPKRRPKLAIEYDLGW